MKEFIKKNIIVILLLCIFIILLIVGFTIAYNANDIGIVISSGEYGVVYSGEANIPSGKLQPINDSNLLTSTDKVLTVSFTVKGVASNPTNKDIIYDVSLTDINIPEELKSEYLKWRLYKNSTKISEGNFSKTFDSLSNQRMVLTNTQQDLPSNSDNADSYVFYIWISESCTETDITDCSVELDQMELTNKTFSGNIKIELSTGSKKELVRNPALATLTKLGLTSSIQDITLPESFTTSSANDSYPDGIYAVEDDIGTSYVFRGNVTNNYVKFGKYTEDVYSIVTDTGSSWEYSYASSCPDSYEYCTKIANANDDMYWRIVRINGDGSIRLIYDGTSAYANNSTSKNSITGYRIKYNYNSNDNAYVGYMYGTPGSTTYEATHANTNDSDLKKSIDAWYAKYLNGTSYEDNITDAIYCNDRTTNTTSTTWGSYTFTGQGYGTNNTLYGMVARSNLYTNTLNMYNNMTPKLTCEQQNDRFSVNNSVVGVATNGKLTYPVATITADEMVYAGMYIYINNDEINNQYDITYLYLSVYLPWTMSALNYNSTARVWSGYRGAVFDGDSVGNSWAARASVSLDSNVSITGDGTQTNPFTIE